MKKTERKYKTYEQYWQAVEENSFKRNVPSINSSNRKTGRACLTLSFPPSLSCRCDAPCAKICYARKGKQTFPNVLGAYLRNHRLYRENPEKFEKMVNAQIFASGLSLFRFFDSGDFPDEEFVRLSFRVARANPQVNFMAFTKQYELVNKVLEEEELPENFCIRFSAWDKNWNVPNLHNLPMAYVDFKNSALNPKIPQNAFVCKGGTNGVTCSNCRMCFNKKVKAIRLLQH